MTFGGADTGRLLEIEQSLGSLVERLSGAESSGQRLVSGVRSAWFGVDAERFVVEWSGQDVAALVALRDAVSSARDTVRLNRQAQDDTSESVGGPGGVAAGLQAGGVVVLQGTGALVSAGGLRVIDRPDGRRITSVDGAPPAVGSQAVSAVRSATSFGELSDAHVEYLMEHRPELLFRLGDLPPDVYADAEAAVLEHYADELPVVGMDAFVSVEADIAWFEASAEASAEIVQYRDGSVTVELALTGSLGAELDAGAAEVGGGVESSAIVEYRFETRAEAEQFLGDLRGELQTADAGGFVAELERHEVSLESMRIEGGVYAEVEGDVGVVEGELRAGGGVGRDVHNNETYLYAQASLEVDASELPGGPKIEVDAGFRAIDPDGPGEGRVEFSGHLVGESEALADMLGLPPGSAAGGSVVVEGEIDRSDPAAAAAYDRFVAGEGSFRDVVEASELVVTVGAGVSHEGEFEFGAFGAGVEVEYGARATANLESFVKPPGTLHVVRAPDHLQCVAPIEVM